MEASSERLREGRSGFQIDNERPERASVSGPQVGDEERRLAIEHVRREAEV